MYRWVCFCNDYLWVVWNDGLVGHVIVLVQEARDGDTIWTVVDEVGPERRGFSWLCFLCFCVFVFLCFGGLFFWRWKQLLRGGGGGEISLIPALRYKEYLFRSGWYPR
uniref:Transmembrane protein n=1 Tax=Compsopogon caeruleus TaxID=31354 RepID=A0A6T6B657_9RHOD